MVFPQVILKSIKPVPQNGRHVNNEESEAQSKYLVKPLRAVRLDKMLNLMLDDFPSPVGYDLGIRRTSRNLRRVV